MLKYVFYSEFLKVLFPLQKLSMLSDYVQHHLTFVFLFGSLPKPHISASLLQCFDFYVCCLQKTRKRRKKTITIYTKFYSLENNSLTLSSACYVDFVIEEEKPKLSKRMFILRIKLPLEYHL